MISHLTILHTLFLKEHILNFPTKNTRGKCEGERETDRQTDRQRDREKGGGRGKN